MDESRSLDHDFPHPDNNHVGFHPQLYIQQDPEQRLCSDNDPVQFTGPISTEHPFENLEMSLELGYGDQFGTATNPGYSQPLPCTTYDLLQDAVDAGHMLGTGIDTIDAEMTTNQAVSQDIYNFIHRDQFVQQQALTPNSLATPYTSLEFSNQTQQAPQVVSDSPYLHGFQQHGARQSGFTTFPGPLGGSTDLDSEFLAAEFVNHNYLEIQASMNNSSPSFNGALASIDAPALTSSRSTSNAIATTYHTWPVADNRLTQPVSIPCLPMITSSPMASLEPQLQELGVGDILDLNEFLNETSAVGFPKSIPENMSHQNDATAPAMEIIEISDYHRGSQGYSPIRPNNNNILRPTFGPSRPISLPPARKGGRKGPLSAEEKKQTRESRKQGICIRCRKTKVKCRGGFPCDLCRETSKATIWIYPCIKADFLDIIQCGSYFLGLATFQKQNIEVMDDKCILDQLAAILILKDHRPFDAIVVGIPELLEAYCAILWPAVAKMMGDICIENQALTSRQIVEAPIWLTKSTDRVVPFWFSDFGGWKTRKMWILLRVLLCEEKHQHKPLDTPQDFFFSEEGKWRSVLDTFAWISKRYAEITLFQYLQHAANRLSSLSTTELSETASGFLQVLYTGLISELEGVFNDSKEIPVPSEDYLDRKKRIRIAMFVYLKMTVDKLPAWSDFWQEMPDAIMPLDPEILKASLASINDCDIQATEFFGNAKKRFDYFFHGREIFPGEATPVEKQTIAFKNKETFWEMLSGIFQGPYDLRSELEWVRDGLTQAYDPRFIALNTAIERVIDREELQNERKPLQEVLEFGRNMIKANENVRQWIGSVLEMEPKFEGDDSTCQDIKDGLAKVDVHMRRVLEFDMQLDLKED